MMERKSISDFYGFSLFIFDLDNTIYDEENYLFDAYDHISESISRKVPSLNTDDLSLTLRKLYQEQGRTNLFNKFLSEFDLSPDYLPHCLHILRSFIASKKYKIFPPVKTVLEELINRKKSIYVLTNGNPGQQRNKIRNINWEEIDRAIVFVLADEFEPKPSSAGIEYILSKTYFGKNESVMIGDSDTDRECARNGGIHFINVEDLCCSLKQ